jgi:hypothetical protein
MPSKRSALTSPNPVKHQLLDDVSHPDDTTHSILNAEPAAAHIPMPSPPQLMDVVSETAAPSRPIKMDAMTAELSPPSASAGSRLQSQQCPASPGLNRAKFFSAHASAGTVCNLDLSRASLGSKVHLTGILTAVYPASKNPDRRYILLSDVTGTVGLTVWNANVDPMNKLTIWWRDLALMRPVPLGEVQMLSDNAIVCVSGILGFVTAESKNVGNEIKTLTTLHMVDKTGSLTVRSWNHVPSIVDFSVEKPLLLQRIRITSFAGQKLGELLDGTGTIVVSEFEGAAELAQFWVD